MSDDPTNLTLRQRRRMQQSEGAPHAGPKSKRRLLWALLSIGFVCLIGVGVWAWLHFHHGADPRLQEILALQAKVDKLDNPLSDEARALQKQIWEQAKDLPDDSKAQLRQNMHGSMDMRLDRFFQMSSKDQLALIDGLIAGFQAMEAMQKVKDAIGGSTSTNANSGSGKGGGKSDAQRMQGWQKMLSNMPPERRAQWGLGRQMFNSRMQQQGLTPPPGGGFH